MKNIKPISIWSNGESKLATKMHLLGNDNLINSVMFYYSLHAETGEKLADGNLVMSGEDYESWQDNPYAWDWAAKKLNLTLIPEEKPDEKTFDTKPIKTLGIGQQNNLDY